MGSSHEENARYDVIVVGARCAGSPTAMLLARQGYKVLVVDRATFPSDTLSTHLIHPPGVAALQRWGLLERLVATGCPPIGRYAFDFGPVTISGSPATADAAVAYAPRRTVLDKLLVDAAVESGAEIREGFAVEELVFDEDRVAGVRGRQRGGNVVEERAQVVVGADGRHSLLARTLKPEQYHDKPKLLSGYYGYFRDLPVEGFETYVRPARAWAVWPTNDELTLVIGGWPYSEFEANRKDVDGNWFKMFETAPQFAERIAAATQHRRLAGTAVANYFRKPYGPGWALVGDAGYNKDFITAQGIQDAFRDAELCAGAIDRALSGSLQYDEAMALYQSVRDDEVLPMFEFTCELATLEPPPPEMQQLLGAVQGNQEAMDQFVRVTTGSTSPADFFSPENVGRIFAEAERREARAG